MGYLDKLKNFFTPSEPKEEIGLQLDSDGTIKLNEESALEPEIDIEPQSKRTVTDKYRGMFGKKTEAKRLTTPELVQFFPGAFTKEEKERLTANMKKEHEKQYIKREAEELKKYPVEGEARKKRKAVFRALREEYGIDAKEPDF